MRNFNLNYNEEEDKYSINNKELKRRQLSLFLGCEIKSITTVAGDFYSIVYLKESGRNGCIQSTYVHTDIAQLHSIQGKINNNE